MGAGAFRLKHKLVWTIVQLNDSGGVSLLIEDAQVFRKKFVLPIAKTINIEGIYLPFDEFDFYPIFPVGCV